MKKALVILLALLLALPVCAMAEDDDGAALTASAAFAENVEPVRRAGIARLCAAFTVDEPVTAQTREIGEGLTATVITAARPGADVYVVAGLHGDETAGWAAGDLLKTASIRAGRLTVVSPANPHGAQKRVRATEDGCDLNRAFPGSADGGAAERKAAAIFADIAAVSPALVLDLHESHPSAVADSLCNSLVCQSQDGLGSAVFEFLAATQAGEVCTVPFDLFGGPPEGSLNRAAATLLGIPAVTVETARERALTERVSDQLSATAWFLQWFGLL